MKLQGLAEWYLRLNGFLTIRNFIVHPATRGPQLGEIDILGVRFPFRAEFSLDDEVDDNEFASISGRPYFVIAEATRRRRQLNDSWFKAESRTLHELLRAVGLFRDGEELNRIAKALRESLRNLTLRLREHRREGLVIWRPQSSEEVPLLPDGTEVRHGT